MTNDNDISFDADKFRIAAEFSPVHMIFADADGIIVYANPAAQRITGYDRKEMIGKPLSLWGGKMPAEFYDRMWQTIKVEKVPFHGEIQQTRMNGDAYTAEIWMTPVIIESGELSGFVGVEMDASDRKKLLSDIKESEQQFRQMTENIKELFFLADPRTGKLLYLSPAFETIFGFSIAEAYANPEKWFAAIDKEDQPLMLRATENGVAGKPSSEELRIHLPDGTLRWIRFRSYPVFNEKNEPYRVAGFTEDITLEKESWERMRADEVRIKELDVLKNKFIQIVSHQFRTPLNAVRWNLEMLLSSEYAKINKENESLVRVSYEATTEVIKRVGDLLTAFDIEEGRITLEKEDVDLESLVSGALGESMRRCEQRSLTCKAVRSETSIPTLQMDATKFRIALSKIIENAVQYTAPGGTVTVQMKRVDGTVRIEVTDTGIGIPEMEQKRIFLRFFRGSNASTMEPDASGLGLYIAKYYIEAHGGTIDFSSKEGQGSTFSIELPLTKKA